jgi:epoxyqueuosine reductase QueG
MERDLFEYLKEKGADLVSSADLRELPKDIQHGLNVGISIAVKSDFLQGRGYETINLAVTEFGIDPETLSTALPHKTVATKSGLGWIGKNALLVTRPF